jgi:hypothetical protein
MPRACNPSPWASSIHSTASDDGNAPARAQHGIQVAVFGVVVVVDVAGKAQVGKKNWLSMRRRCNAGHRRASGAAAGQQLVHIAQQLLHIQLGVFVLRQAGGGFEQGKVLVALHQRGKILQCGRNGIAQRHGRFVRWAPGHVKPHPARV